MRLRFRFFLFFQKVFQKREFFEMKNNPYF